MLTAILCFTVMASFPVNSSAATVGDDLICLHWTLDDNGRLDITRNADGYDGIMYDFPFSDNIVAWQGYRNRVKTVVIHEGVENIGNNAFAGCVNLSSVTLPDSLVRIGQYAFLGCSSLKEFTLPHWVTMYPSVFAECTALTHFEFPEESDYVSSNLFRDCTALRRVTLPGSIRQIGSFAFYNCTVLTDISLPDGLEVIDREAFACCKKLAKLSIPPTVTYIGAFAFTECAFAAISVPPGVTELRDGVFSNCPNLASVTFLGPVVNIMRQAFWGCKGLRTLSLPETVTEIGTQAFYDCTNLESLSVRSDTVAIDEQAFQDCARLTLCCRLDSDAYAFAAGHGIPRRPLTEHLLLLPDGLEEIPSEAFAGLADADAVRIPAGVKRIADDAFAGSNVVLLLPSGSPWIRWASEHGLEAFIEQ